MAQQNTQFEGASQDPNLIIQDLPFSNRSSSRQINNNNKYNKSYNNNRNRYNNYNDYDDRNHYSTDYNQRNNGYYQNNNDRYYNNNTDSSYTPIPNHNISRNTNQRSNENFAPHKTENSNQKSINQQNRSKTTKPTKRHNDTKTTKQVQTRSEILIEQLTKFTLECMVCCQKVRNDKAIWSCSVCFHIFHLHCIKKWAQSPAAKTDTDNLEKWRCPGCQSINSQIPNKYKCFCGKKTNPEIKTAYYSRQLPHSCGQLCGKSLANLNLEQTFVCKHNCVLSCHPGPCQQCEALVTRTCDCTKAKFQVKCSSLKAPICTDKCDRQLQCGKHICDVICHSGDCKPCQIDIEQHCYSHETKQLIKCNSRPTVANYTCGKPCNKVLKCGNHLCEDKCHDGECTPCSLMPSKLTNCPCGKTQMRYLLLANKLIRTSCLDPVPTCDKKCRKRLHLDHYCKSICHLNDCPPCLEPTEHKCRCGKETDQVECYKKEFIKLCTRKCQKKRLCGKHQCNEACCNDQDHFCDIICNRLLDCGQHKCDLLCHKGPCHRCLVASFDERVCDCGKTVQYPPIRCGTKPLDCPNQCARQHDCLHPINHNCHWEAKCPPCSHLTSKMCMGNHELRHNIPCFIKDISCGRECNRQLADCSHKCNKICHKEQTCQTDNDQCVQLCDKDRPYCEHKCSEPCHGSSSCPNTVCRAVVQIKCPCGLKQKQIKCSQQMYEQSSQIIFENLATEIKEMLSCRTIDLESFQNTPIMKKKHDLACDEECLLAARNKNLSEVLLVEQKVIYSDFLKNYAREEPKFVFDLERKFESFVKDIKQSVKITRRLFNLPAMKSYDRKFIYELATYYGFETTRAQETDPDRSVCVIVVKDKCLLPVPTLMQSVEVKSKQTTISRLTSIKQLLQVASNPLESNFLPITSNNFAILNEEIDDETVSSKNGDRNSKHIDYFDESF